MWFEGPIESAVNKAKTEKRLLIVFICGEDENSRRVLEYWSDDAVKNLVIENSCIALKLAEGSAASKQFAQIYPVISIPVCFFINTASGGLPLEVIIHFESLEDFKARLMKTIDSFGNPPAPSSQPGSSDSTTTNQLSKQSPEQPQETPSPAGSAEKNVASSSELQDRVQKAQALVKQRQEEKARDEQEKLRIAELKRRQEGQDFQKAQDRVKEAEVLKNAYEQKKAKQEDKEHLKKLRDQIAADRAEKAAKFDNKVQAESKKQEEKKSEKAEMNEQQRLEEEEKRKRFSLLQFRLPDGSSIRNQFEGTALFGEAETWYARETNSALSSFILVQMYPRREFTADDLKRSLSELGLTPNASLMVLPNIGAGSSPNGPIQGGNQGFVSWIFSSIAYAVGTPIRYVYGLMYTFIFGPAAAAPRPVTGGASANIANNPTASSDQKAQQQRVAVAAAAAAAAAASTSGGKGSSGNVVRFHNAQDNTNKKDDDEATWNGNSTQQL